MSNFLNHLFDKGKITTILDGGAGSSGKGKIGSYVAENSDNWQFCCSTFSAQAGHWVKLDDGRKFFYQTLNSCAYLHNKFEKMYISSSSVIELPALLREIEENGIPRSKIGISPCAVVLQPKDSDFEKGLVDLDGNPIKSDGLMKKGTTAHGIGAATVRKILRRDDCLYAKDVPEIKEMVCNVSEEIMQRLDKGQSGLGELAQGFQLSLNHPKFLGYTTSRNVTVAQFLSDLFIPTKYAGQIIINFRTFPIRINSNKYIGKGGTHLTFEDIQNGVEHTVYQGNSGPMYDDQIELTWPMITVESGSPDPIFEITSVTKLPRRVFTFSHKNLEESIRYNDTGYPIHLSLNFADYVDFEMSKVRSQEYITSKFQEWVADNFAEYSDKLMFIGTGPNTEDTILIDNF